MAPLAETLSSRFKTRSRDPRKSPRQKSGSKAWIRVEGEFAIRSCTIADVSDSGVRLILDTTQPVSGPFTLLFSRNARQGRRCRVKWRRGAQLGAEFG